MRRLKRHVTMEAVPPYDPAQTQTIEWVRAVLSRLEDLCTVEVVTQNGITAWRCVVEEPVRAQVAWRLAVTIAAERLAVVPGLFFEWFATASSSTDAPLPDETAERMRRRGLLVAVGEPGSLANPSHFYGLVSESLLGELLWEVDRGLGEVTHVEGHDWSPTDPGGDKLVIYGTGASMAFRLWESKARHGNTSVNGVVKEAADQLELRSIDYLARFSIVVSKTSPGTELSEFAAKLPDLWADNDPCGGVGVGLTTHAIPAGNTCFAQLADRFTVLPNANKSGQLALVGPVETFAEQVRQLLWKGMGLWTAP